MIWKIQLLLGIIDKLEHIIHNIYNTNNSNIIQISGNKLNFKNIT